MISWPELNGVISTAEARFSPIRAAYEDLSMYLVFASRLGQTGIHSTPLQIMQEFPGMIADSPARRAALDLAGTIHHLESCRQVAQRMPVSKLPNKNAVIEDLENRLKPSYVAVKERIPGLGVRDDVHVEIRFRQLRYSSIWKLQTDARVDRKRTPRSKASIRVVLGVLAGLAADHNDLQNTACTTSESQERLRNDQREHHEEQSTMGEGRIKHATQQY